MKRPVIAIAIAIALAALAAAGAFAYTVQASARAVAAAGETVAVLVAAQPIGTGTPFADAQASGAIEEREFPATAVPAGAVTAATPVTPQDIAVAPLDADRILMRGDFASALPVTGPLAVPEGKLAVSLELSDPARVGTFLRPGSQIAVYATVDATAAGGAGAVAAPKTTNLVVDRVTVLGVGDATQTQASSADEQAQSTALVTVAVDQQQAARIVQAVQTGALYLALLGEGTGLVPAAGVTGPDVFLTTTAR